VLAVSLRLLQNVKEGLIAENSAIAVLVELYGFSPEIARSTVTGEVIPENVAAEMRAVFEKQDEDAILIEYFKNCGSTDYEPVGNGKALNFESETSARLHEELNRKYWFAEIDPIRYGYSEHSKRESSYSIPCDCRAVTTFN
jgi:hypothetical protein